MAKTAEQSSEGPSIGRDADWTEVERALTELENGIAVLYGLARANDDDKESRALYFTARRMSDEVKRTQKALGYRAGGKPEETDTN
jgi:hypothetical protein